MTPATNTDPLKMPARWPDFALFLLLLSLPIVGWIALTYPPTLASQGQASRILFFHVPIAWVALYAPCLAALSGGLYLYTRRETFDIWSLASARIAFVFAIGVVFTGGIWGSVEWGVFWSFHDPRLMSFAILVLTLASYFLARWMTEDKRRAALYGAVAAILAAVAALLTWFAIRLVTPDLHPGPVIATMSPKIRLSFWLSVLAFHFLFLALLRASIRHERLRRKAQELSLNLGETR